MAEKDAELTVENMNKIMTAVMLGKPHGFKSKEALEFAKQFSEDMVQAQKDGMVMAVPPE